MNPHPGIRIHAIPVAGVGGLIFTVGSLLIFLIGVPLAKWFLLGSAAVGVLVFGLIRLLRRFSHGSPLTFLVISKRPVSR